MSSKWHQRVLTDIQHRIVGKNKIFHKEIRKYKVMFLTGVPDEYEQVEDRYCLQQNNPHCHYYHRDSHHRGPRLHQVH